MRERSKGFERAEYGVIVFACWQVLAISTGIVFGVQC